MIPEKTKPAATLFMELSAVLTGQKDLDVELSAEYYMRISRSFEDTLAEILERFAKAPANQKKPAVAAIMTDAKLGPVAKEIIILWYFAGFFDPGRPKGQQELGPETAEQYLRGLLWPTIHAHPPGLSGGYFGYWKYPPEN